MTLHTYTCSSLFGENLGERAGGGVNVFMQSKECSFLFKQSCFWLWASLTWFFVFLIWKSKLGICHKHKLHLFVYVCLDVKSGWVVFFFLYQTGLAVTMSIWLFSPNPPLMTAFTPWHLEYVCQHGRYPVEPVWLQPHAQGRCCKVGGGPGGQGWACQAAEVRGAWEFRC